MVPGSNEQKTYLTKLVEILIIFGARGEAVIAFSLPKININFFLPNLRKIVEGLISKIYKLADEKFNSPNPSISHVHFILGFNFGYCNPERNFIWNFEEVNMPHDSIGSVVERDEEQLLCNISDLPLNSPSSLTLNAPCLSSCMENVQNMDKQTLVRCSRLTVECGIKINVEVREQLLYH